MPDSSGKFLLHKKSKDGYSGYFKALVSLALLSSLLHPPLTVAPMTWTLTRFVFGILCFQDIRFVNPYLFTKMLTSLSPLIIIPHYILTNPFGYGAYRYAGFYGDPNFMAIALLLLIVSAYITIKVERDVFWSFIGYFVIISAIPLIFVGMSRGGLTGLGLIVFIMLSDLWKTNKKVFSFIVACFVFSIGSVVAEFSELLEYIGERFLNESGSDEYSTLARWYGVQSALTVFVNYPIVIPFGIGLGNTVSSAHEYVQYGCFYKSEIHNTFISLMYEGGVFMFFVYVSVYWKLFMGFLKYRNYLLIAMLVSLFISLNTLPGASFMPGWISLFLLCNQRILIISKYDECKNSNTLYLYR